MKNLKDKASSITCSLMSLVVLLVLGAQAQAIIILDPTDITISSSGTTTLGNKSHDWDFGSCQTCDPTGLGTYLVYPPPSNNLGGGFIGAITGDSDLSLLYKDNVGGDEEGSFTDNYTTVFSLTASDPSNADITWDGGAFMTDAKWLEVKDGNQDPYTYLFDISSWDGMMALDLNNFWTGEGAISHVAIWGGDTTTSLPEPGALSLLAIGLVGIAWIRRRKIV